jgi:hypothetical protein
MLVVLVADVAVDGVTNSGVDEVGAVDMTAMRLVESERVNFSNACLISSSVSLIVDAMSD